MDLTEIYFGIKTHIPEVCPKAIREGNHFDCPSSCVYTRTKEKYICPCLGKDGSGWIPVTVEWLQKRVDEVKKWNKAREKIPYKNAYSLKRIKHFKVGRYELLIERFGRDDAEKVKKEMLRLFKNGDKVGFNEDYGVGRMIDNKDGTYTVEKWYYHSKSNPVVNGTLDDVFNFLFEFWGSPEPFSYTKAGHPELERYP